MATQWILVDCSSRFCSRSCAQKLLITSSGRFNVNVELGHWEKPRRALRPRKSVVALPQNRRSRVPLAHNGSNRFPSRADIKVEWLRSAMILLADLVAVRRSSRPNFVASLFLFLFLFRLCFFSTSKIDCNLTSRS